ncbi:aldehyde dehydrogenase domain-containing protein [Phialemonium atrogriseum]|uniref:aldehyde dehydrogenase (NAD(+)) n=1 Tax=Phialemonium atrogriseum TaxID=1093897 RepID=A0AAJ0BT17_9PEZI|nr:aldehyde dehydrogenase domain-containing protein [Phialemonium atrogriseum]KAK1763973.1 aldehyde dehydrogenase domain-containing protein [Phialemonium atrogriseum]
MELEPHLTKIFIDNEYVDCRNDKTISVYNPATRELVSDKIPVGGQEDINAAVKAALKACEHGSPWQSMTGQDRQKILLKFADILEANQEYLAKLTRLTLGAPYRPFGKSEIDTAIGCFRYYAGWTDKYAGQSFPADDGFYKIVRNEPLGVVAGIIPWNGPIASVGLKAAPALATGNVFILKPSEKTPLAAAALGKLIIEAGFPPGVFQVVTGDGTTGALLASNMQVAKVSFTGSIATGKAVQVMATKSNMKRVTLELGGKSPAVVFDDADLENAVKWTVNALTTNSGQICFAATRVYVQAGIYDKFIEAYVEGFKNKMKMMGNPDDANSEIGPVVDKAQYDRIMNIICTAQDDREGTLLAGGSSLDSEKGYYIQPTVFCNTRPDAPIYKDEIFGPVAVINKFESERDVVRRSNDSRYGLMAGVFTQDINRALRVSSRFDSGVVGINCISHIHFSCPFGGTKESGLGREMGEHALRAYTEPKTVLINMNY